MSLTFKPMLAQTIPENAIKQILNNPEWIAEWKYDGTRAIMIKDKGTIRIYGRSGNEYTERYPQLIKEAQKFEANSFIIDGEITFYQNGKEKFLTALATEQTKQNLQMKYNVFDIIQWDDIMYDDYCLKARKEQLHLFFETRIQTRIREGGVQVQPSSSPSTSLIKQVVYCINKKEKFWRKVQQMKGEGIILKNLYAEYYEGRSKEWLKLKDEKTTDVVVKGWTVGEGRREYYFGALECWQKDKQGEWVYVGNVGGGFSDEELERMTKRLIVKPFEEFVIEVKYLNRTEYGKLRMPRFVRVREDKKIEECIING